VAVPAAIRRPVLWAYHGAQWIHTGDLENREVFGDNPNQLSHRERLVNAGFIMAALSFGNRR